MDKAIEPVQITDTDDLQPVILRTHEEAVRSKLEAAWNEVSQLPGDWQTAIWTPLVEMFPIVQKMQEKLIEQRQLIHQQNFTLQEQAKIMADLRDRLERARAHSVESVVTDASIQLDASAETIRLFLDAMKGEYAGLLGNYRMQDLEDFINEIGGEIYEYQQASESDYRDEEEDFDPEDNYQ